MMTENFKQKIAVDDLRNFMVEKCVFLYHFPETDDVQVFEIYFLSNIK